MRVDVLAGAGTRAREAGPGAPSAAEEELADRDELRHLMHRYHQEHHAPYFENPYAEEGEDGSVAQEDCGREVAWGQDVDVFESEDGERLYARGLKRCGSVWCCASCAPRVAFQKGEELEEAVESWQEHGGTVELLSLTMRHHQGQHPDLLTDCLQLAWERIRTRWGGWFDDLRDHYDIHHYYQTTEITFGPNGPHPHRHVLLFIGGEWSEEDRAQVEQEIWRTWSSALTRIYENRKGDLGVLPRDRDPSRCDRTVLDPPSRDRAVQIDGAGSGAGHYVSKLGLAREVARVDVKEGRNGNRTPWEILRDAALERDPDADRLWRQYIETMHGRCHSYSSHGFGDDPRLQRPQLEADLEEPDAETDERAWTIGAYVWRRLYREHGDELMPTLYRVYRCSGWRDLAALIRRLLEYTDAAGHQELRIDHDRRDVFYPALRQQMQATVEGV